MSIKEREQWNYLRHLYRPYKYKFPYILEFIKFSIVGFSGIFVDMGTVIVLKEMFNLYTLICAVGGFLMAVTSNYFLNRYWSFELGRYTPILKSYTIFVAVCCLGLSVRLITMYLFIEYAKFDTGKWYMFNNFIGIMIASLINFIGTKFWTFSAGKESNPAVK
jgi:putative flippase GtrA